MKDALKYPAAVLVMIALILAIGWYFSGRNERQIMRRQRQLVELLAKTGLEKELGALTRAQEISTFFHAAVALNLQPYLSGTHTQREMAGLAYHFRGMVEELSIEVADHNLEIGPDRQTAVLLMVARAKAKYGGEWDQDLREVKMNWTKTGNDWLIAGVEFTSAIVRPEGL